MRIRKLDADTRKNILEDLLKRSPNQYREYEERVQAILARVREEKDQALFDYTFRFDHAKVDASSIRVTEEEIEDFLAENKRTLPRRNWIPDNKRTSGLFIYDVAIDLRTLFCVSMNQHEPEITKEMIEELKSSGWIESENVFGKCLVLPKENREKIIPVLAKALIEWRITSNQSRTFSPMETLAVAISDNANTLTAAIRAKLIEDGEKPKAKPVIDPDAGADLFVTLPCAAYIPTEIETVDALKQAEERLIEMISAFDFEQQEIYSNPEIGGTTSTLF